jgi:hypothetical protein
MTAHYEPDPLDAEWDKLPHTLDDYRKEIRQLRERCAAYAAAVEAEREACAKVCEARHMGDNNREDAEARRCAAAIRARDEP